MKSKPLRLQIEELKAQVQDLQKDRVRWHYVRMQLGLLGDRVLFPDEVTRLIDQKIQDSEQPPI